MLKLNTLAVKILAYYFMNPDSRHYSKELADILSADQGNLSRTMIKLKKEGLFITEKEGKNKYYILNKNFHLLNEYKNIYEASFGVEVLLRNTLSSVPGLKEAYIFGSYVKGNFEEGSDIDVLLIGRHAHDIVAKKINELEKRWGREINTVDYSVEEYERKFKEGDDFLTSILANKNIKLV